MGAAARSAAACAAYRECASAEYGACACSRSSGGGGVRSLAEGGSAAAAAHLRALEEGRDLCQRRAGLVPAAADLQGEAGREGYG